MFAAGVKLGCIVEATEQIENITLEKQPISPIEMHPRIRRPLDARNHQGESKLSPRRGGPYRSRF
jgi:hypothetical protein